MVSPTEVLINGKTLGTTSLFLWDNTGAIKLYSVEVTADAPGLQRYLTSVLAGEKIDVIASGNVVTLSGTVRDASVANRAVEIAKGSGATIVDNLTTPEAVQVLLNVRFAEVNKSAIKEFRSQLATLNPHDLNDQGDWRGSANTDPTRRRLLPMGSWTSDSSTPTPASSCSSGPSLEGRSSRAWPSPTSSRCRDGKPPSWPAASFPIRRSRAAGATTRSRSCSRSSGSGSSSRPPSPGAAASG